MTPAEQIIILLTGYTPLTAIVGNKVSPLRAGPGVVRPFVSYFDVFADPQNSLSGWSGTDNTLIQFDIWSDSYGQALSIAAHIRAAMALANVTFSGICRREFDGPVEQTAASAPGLEVYHRIVEFSIWNL